MVETSILNDRIAKAQGGSKLQHSRGARRSEAIVILRMREKRDLSVSFNLKLGLSLGDWVEQEGKPADRLPSTLACKRRAGRFAHKPDGKQDAIAQPEVVMPENRVSKDPFHGGKRNQFMPPP